MQYIIYALCYFRQYLKLSYISIDSHCFYTSLFAQYLELVQCECSLTASLIQKFNWQKCSKIRLVFNNSLQFFQVHHWVPRNTWLTRSSEWSYHRIQKRGAKDRWRVSSELLNVRSMPILWKIRFVLTSLILSCVLITLGNVSLVLWGISSSLWGIPSVQKRGFSTVGGIPSSIVEDVQYCRWIPSTMRGYHQ